jgi:hypothetical protein
MSEMRFDPQQRDVLDSMLLSMPGVKRGQAFGQPAYYINGKMFACLNPTGVSVKLPKEQAAALIDGSTFVPFEPMPGRAMGGWVLVIHPEAENYRQDESLLQQAFEYVSQLAK